MMVMAARIGGLACSTPAPRWRMRSRADLLHQDGSAATFSASYHPDRPSGRSAEHGAEFVDADGPKWISLRRVPGAGSR
jgi:hypothetical protein